MGEGKFEHPFLDNLAGIPQGDSEQKAEAGKLVEEHMRHYGSKKESLEIEKSPRDIEILEFAIDSASEIMRRYGREKEIEIPLDHIHIVPVGGTKNATKGRSELAAQSSTRASIVIDRDGSDIQFCLRVFHEILHLKSYKALQFTQSEGDELPTLKPYRSGFVVRSRKGPEQYFDGVEEGLVGILVERFFDEKIQSSDLFSEELKEKNKSDYEFSRQYEIRQVNALADLILEKNKDQFSSRDEVLDLFFKAQINGNLLTVGKLIEKTLGKGSFREVGERSGNVPKENQ